MWEGGLASLKFKRLNNSLEHVGNLIISFFWWNTEIQDVSWVKSRKQVNRIVTCQSCLVVVRNRKGTEGSLVVQGRGAKVFASMTFLCCSSNQVSNCGFIWSILLNDSLKFSKLLMAVWQQFTARLTSVWVKPSLTLQRLNLLAKSIISLAKASNGLARARCCRG